MQPSTSQAESTQRIIFPERYVVEVTAYRIASAIESGESLAQVARELVVDRGLSEASALSLCDAGLAEWRRRNLRSFALDIVFASACFGAAVLLMVWVQSLAQDEANRTGEDVRWRVPFAWAPFVGGVYFLRRSYKRWRWQSSLARAWKSFTEPLR